MHFGDWPNAVGFDAHYEERQPVELRVDGNIPDYVSGVLFRTGLGPRTVATSQGSTFRVNHWFDNFAQIHRFQIRPQGAGQPSKVIYNSRLTSDGLLEKVKKTGKLDGITFASKYEPCKSFFKKIQTVFSPTTELAVNEVNVGVTMEANFPGHSSGLHSGEKSLPSTTEKLPTVTVCTDAQYMQILDPETLEPIGVARQTSLHPDLTGFGSAAHAEHDPVTGDVFNFNLDAGRISTYRVFRASASTGKASILATIKHAPAYLHSLSMTENFVILCVWNSFYTMSGASILWNQNLLDSMAWSDKQPAKWFVIDKKALEDGGKGLVATYESDPFFCFHTINAFENKETSDGTVDIIADLVGYSNLNVISKFYYDNLVSDSPNAAAWSDKSNDHNRPTYRRYRLASVPSLTNSTATASTSMRAPCEYEGAITSTPELPTFNPQYTAKPHRYIYGINDSGKSSFNDSLIKLDIQTNSVLRWSVHGHTAGEAIFIPDPKSTEEDGGVLLTVVLDGVQGKSYLLVLNARDMKEVARAHVDGVVGMAFHGMFVGEKGGLREEEKKPLEARL